jgi:hypothetical protein
VENQNKFSFLRKVLSALGLSAEAVDDIIDRITDFLSDKGEKSPEGPKYPYVLHESFLSPAEHNFFSVLRTTVSDQALINIKVGLGDLFDAKSKDPANSAFTAIRSTANTWTFYFATQRPCVRC